MIREDFGKQEANWACDQLKKRGVKNTSLNLTSSQNQKGENPGFGALKKDRTLEKLKKNWIRLYQTY